MEADKNDIGVSNDRHRRHDFPHCNEDNVPLNYTPRAPLAVGTFLTFATNSTCVKFFGYFGVSAIFSALQKILQG